MTTKRLLYRLAPSFEAFAEVARQFGYELDLAEVPGRTRHACEVVLEEVVTNVIRHGGNVATTTAAFSEIYAASSFGQAGNRPAAGSRPSRTVLTNRGMPTAVSTTLALHIATIASTRPRSASFSPPMRNA